MFNSLWIKKHGSEKKLVRTSATYRVLHTAGGLIYCTLKWKMLGLCLALMYLNKKVAGIRQAHQAHKSEYDTFSPPKRLETLTHMTLKLVAKLEKAATQSNCVSRLEVIWLTDRLSGLKIVQHHQGSRIWW